MKRSGFTLLQLLIVLGILVLAFGLLLLALMKVDDGRDRIHSTNNLRCIAVGVYDVLTAYDYVLPYTNDGVSEYGGQRGSWFYHFLPYLEANPAFVSRNPSTYVNIFHAPADPSWDKFVHGLTSYAPNILITTGMKITDITDGTEHTVMACERYADANNAWHFWADVGGLDANNGAPQILPALADAEDLLAQGMSRTGTQCAMYDGSVRTAPPGIDDALWLAANTPRGKDAKPDW